MSARAPVSTSSVSRVVPGLFGSKNSSTTSARSANQLDTYTQRQTETRTKARTQKQREQKNRCVSNTRPCTRRTCLQEVVAAIQSAVTRFRSLSRRIDRSGRVHKHDACDADRDRDTDSQTGDKQNTFQSNMSALKYKDVPSGNVLRAGRTLSRTLLAKRGPKRSRSAKPQLAVLISALPSYIQYTHRHTQTHKQKER